MRFPVSKNIIMTASHCIQEKNSERKSPRHMSFVLGISNLNDPEGYIYHIKEFVLHPDYSPDLVNADADLALAFLKENIEFNAKIKPICLPSVQNTSIIAKNGLVGGWGKTEKGDTSALQISQLKVVESSVCKNTSDIYSLLMTGRTFCTELSKVGPCMGKK